MFKRPYFIWKGESCKDYFILITTTENEIVNDFGIPYNKVLNKEEGKFIYTEEEGESEEFTLNLTLAENENGTAMVWTEDIYRRICKWLKSDEFERFISYDNLDYCYYLKVTKIQPCFTFGESVGWITVTFKPLSNYAYKIYRAEEIVRGTKQIIINNDTDEDYEPLFIIHNLGSENNTISVNDLEINGIQEDEVVYVDNYMTNVINTKNENRLSCCNRKWVTLKPGENRLFISGDCRITIYCEFPHNV